MAGDLIRPADLVTERTSPVASEFMVVDNGVTVAKSKISDIGNTARPFSNQAEAEAGTSTTKTMTPLATKQAVTARIDVDIASKAQGDKADSAVQPARTITAGTGLTGGGDLSADRSVALSAGSQASLALADTAVQPARAISAGTGLTGGGSLAADRTISLSTGTQASLALADSAVQPYPTAVGLSALTIPDGITFIRTNGYYAVGDGGGAQYRLKDGGEDALPGDQSSNAGGKVWALDGTRITVKMLGVVADYDTDDSAAWQRCLDFFAATKKTLYHDGGNIGVAGSFDWPEGFAIQGIGPARIFTWFDTPDKQNLRPGFKHLISGANLILKDAATADYATNRTGLFASFSYGQKYGHREPMQIEGIGIIQDMDVYDAGGTITTAATDNAADYDVGLVVRSYQASMVNCNVFGYWGTGYPSLVLHSQNDLELVDSDYFRAENSNFTGVAIIGKNGGVDAGITGSTWISCGMYNGADHHTPAGGDYTKASIFVDGNNGIEGLRGHKWLGGNLRTRSNKAISLDRATNVAFEFSATETPILAGVTGADTQGKIVGTTNTGNVRVANVATSSADSLDLDALASTISGSIIAIGGDRNNEILVTRGPRAVRIFVNDVGDPGIQFTTNTDTVTSDWVVMQDISDASELAFRFNGTEVATLQSDGTLQVRKNRLVFSTVTIASGSIAYSRAWHVVDTEAAAITDDLDNITGGVAGDELIITAANSTHDVVLKDGTGNLRLNGDFTLTHANDVIKLLCTGSSWCEVSRSDNTA